MRAAIYTRVSTDRQATEGVSLEMQLARCREAALAQGASAVDVYEDAGESAADLDRPAVRRLLDRLPEYDLLDRIIAGYVEQDLSARELVDSGLPAEVVERVIRMIDRNEYKRRQSAPGVRITQKAFGKDRRLPITNHYTTTVNGRNERH